MFGEVETPTPFISRVGEPCIPNRAASGIISRARRVRPSMDRKPRSRYPHGESFVTFPMGLVLRSASGSMRLTWLHIDLYKEIHLFF